MTTGRPWLVALASPQVLLGFVVLLAALFSYRYARERVQETLTPVTIELAQAPSLSASNIQLVLSDAQGLERPLFQDIALPDTVNQRYQTLLEALKKVSAGVWPDALPVPTVYTETIDQATVLVLDFVVEAPIPVSVAQETQLLNSIHWTLERNGAEVIRILINGRSEGRFLGHLSVPATLDAQQD